MRNRALNSPTYICMHACIYACKYVCIHPPAHSLSYAIPGHTHPNRHDQQTKNNRLLTFHPNSTFSDVTEDPADFALRSPFPTILVLRGTDVREAEDLCDIQGRVTEDIAIANEARLRTVGYEKLRDIFTGIMNSSRSTESANELALIQAQRQQAIMNMVAIEEYEADGFDGLETQTLAKDPVGWFGPSSAELEGGEAREGVEGVEDGSTPLDKPFDPMGYEPGA